MTGICVFEGHGVSILGQKEILTSSMYTWKCILVTMYTCNHGNKWLRDYLQKEKIRRERWGQGVGIIDSSIHVAEILAVFLGKILRPLPQMVSKFSDGFKKPDMKNKIQMIQKTVQEVLFIILEYERFLKIKNYKIKY